MGLSGGILACLLAYGCSTTKSKPNTPLKPTKVVAAIKEEKSTISSKPESKAITRKELSVDDLDYISQNEISQALSKLEEELKEHGQELNKPNLKIFDGNYSIGDLKFCSVADYRTNTVEIHAGNIDEMARNCLQTFQTDKNELERILTNPFVLKKYLGNGREFFMKLKDALFYKAIGPVDERTKPEEFKRLYSTICFLNFLIGTAVNLSDGVPEKEDEFYANVFQAQSFARGALFSGLVLDSFNERWSYFAIGRAFDRVSIGYGDSYRNSGQTIAEMFAYAMTEEHLRKKIF